MTNEEIYQLIKENYFLKELKDEPNKNTGVYTRMLPNGKTKHYQMYLKPIMKICEYCGEMHDMTKPTHHRILKDSQGTLTTCQGGKRYLGKVEITGPVSYS